MAQTAEAMDTQPVLRRVALCSAPRVRPNSGPVGLLNMNEFSVYGYGMAGSCLVTAQKSRIIVQEECCSVDTWNKVFTVLLNVYIVYKSAERTK